ncbi:calcium-binding protein, partial [Thauera sinica]
MQKDIIQAIPDVKTMNDVLVQNYYRDQNTGRDAFGAILDVGMGALAGAIVVSMGGPIVAAIAAGYIAGKAGEWLGEQVWDALTSPEASDSWASALGNEFANEFLNFFLPEGMRPIDRGTNTYFSSARAWRLPVDPLALDLDGDGIETRGADGTVLFDHDGDGIRTGTGWVKADDALLVLDRNGNGAIDGGAELFGVDTVLANGKKATDGFAALRDLDSNGDGTFDAADAQFGNVRLWRDLDQDGVSDAGELMSLGDAGIASISLQVSRTTKTLAGGNAQTATASFTRTDGSTASVGTAANLDLASNPFYREFTNPIQITEQAAALPDMGGSGRVRDLREAASQSSRLADLLDQFSRASTRDAQLALLDELLDAWADTSGMAEDLDSRYPGSFAFLYMGFGNVTRDKNLTSQTSYLGGYVPDAGNGMLTAEYRSLVAEWSNKIHILEAFNGEYFFDLPTQNGELRPGAVGLSNGQSGGAVILLGWPERILNVSYTQGQLDLLQQSYDALKQSVYEGLLSQTRLKPYLDAVQLTIDDSGLKFDFAAMETLLDQAYATDPRSAMFDVLELRKHQGDALLAMGWDGAERIVGWTDALSIDEAMRVDFAALGYIIGSGNVTGTTGDDLIVGQGSNDTLSGDAGADQLYGGNGNDVLSGGDGDDILSGGAGNDVLDGGKGRNVLDGGAGNDRLLVAATSSNNVLAGGAGNDTITGSYYADTYVFNLGDGVDTITDYTPYTGYTDVLQFGEGIAASDIRTLRS